MSTGSDRTAPQQAKAALDQAEHARQVAHRAGAHLARRQFLAFGAASAAATLATGLVDHWIQWHAVWFAWFAALMLLVGAWVRRQPVQPVRSRRLLMITIAAWSVIFGATMAAAALSPLVFPAGAVAGFAVWAIAAWRAGR